MIFCKNVYEQLIPTFEEQQCSFKNDLISLYKISAAAEFFKLHFGVLQQYKNSSSSPYFISYTFDVLSLGTFFLFTLKFE